MYKRHEIDIIVYMYVGTIDTPSLQGRIEGQPDPQKVGASKTMSASMASFTVKTIKNLI